MDDRSRVCSIGIGRLGEWQLPVWTVFNTFSGQYFICRFHYVVYNKLRCSKQFQKLIVGLKKRSLLAFGKCDDLGLLSMNKLRMTKNYDLRRLILNDDGPRAWQWQHSKRKLMLHGRHRQWLLGSFITHWYFYDDSLFVNIKTRMLQNSFERVRWVIHSRGKAC